MTQSKNRIMIYGQKMTELCGRVQNGRKQALAISIPRSEAHVIRHFQERMPYGLFVPEVRSE
jgi:hypothetical protein